MLSSILKYRKFIKDYKVKRFRVAGDSLEIVIAVKFVDGSLLYVRDYTFGRERKYSYHWQRGAELLIRWDNSPHWKHLRTYPHHKHISSEKNIHESKEHNLDAVMNFIVKKLEKRTH
ncbi:MAG: DUF6516 family protein [Halobacteriota archaeon]